jgi:hypothetical protein
MFRALFEPSPDVAVDSLRETGCALLAPAGLHALAAVEPGALESIRESWSRLPADEHLRDGGHYRFRRHACFTIDAADGGLVQVAHRAHYQPIDYNALHGGLERWFEPMAEADTDQPAWKGLLRGLAACCSALKGAQPWYVEAHPFRIDTAGGIGRPTPEGAHRDGVDVVAVVLVARRGIKGGETRVFEADGPNGVRFTLTEPWSLLLLDDARVIHETTPIQPLDPADAADGHRDTLVLTFRAGGFQAPGA